MTTETIVNGINASELGDTIEAVKGQRELGKYKFRASNHWVDGAHCITSIKDFSAGGQEDSSRAQAHVLHGDEPVSLFGEDNGPNAIEAVLHALAACLNTSFIFQAAVQGVRIDELEFDLEGDLDISGFFGIDESVRNGFDDISVRCRVKSDAPKEKLEELFLCAQQRSPVFDIISHPVNIAMTLED